MCDCKDTVQNYFDIPNDVITLTVAENETDDIGFYE